MSRLGEFLMQEGLLGPIDRRKVYQESVRHGGSFARSVLYMGILDEEELGALMASKTTFRRADKDITYEMDPDLGELLPKHVAAWLEVLPLSVKDGVLSLAMVDPTDLSVSNQIRFFTNLRVRPVIATRSEILRGLRKIGAELPAEPEVTTLDLSRATNSENPDAETRGAHDQRQQVKNQDLGIMLVQNAGTSELRAFAEDPVATSKNHSFDQGGDLKSDSRAKPVASSEQPRMESLILGLGAMTDHKAEFYARPRSTQPEPSVAVQAAISLLKRFQVKLQLSKNPEDAVRLFIATVKKAGLSNGVIVRVSNSNVVLGAHWIDAGVESDDGLIVPKSIDRAVLARALNQRLLDQPWSRVGDVFEDRADDIVKFWATASAKPDTVFTVERDDGGLVCLVGFCGQYDHDGLRQIFYDALKTLNSKL